MEERTVLSANVVPPQLTLDAQEYDPSSILVRFQPGAAAGRALEGTELGREFPSVPGLRAVQLGKGVTVDAALQVYRSNPNVLYAEPSYRVHALVMPNDLSPGELYGMEKIAAPAAWDISTGSPSVVVGVIDTGVDYTHPDLAANIWSNPGEIPGDNLDNDGNGYIDDVHGYDFVGIGSGGLGDGDPMDDHGHGTHVSGTIGAVGNNGDGVAGVNWNVRVMGLKFLDAGGSGWTEDAVAALDYANLMRNRGVNIVLTSNSWGGGGYSAALYDAIAASGAANMLFVAAAGNDGGDNDLYEHYPSNYDLPNVISVAATDANDDLAYFSNWGLNSVDLAAPGVNILSTTPGNTYSYYSGTSMATPHVAGVAALAWGLAGNVNYTEIRDAIFNGVDPISAVATDGPTPVATGGRLNAFKTLQAVGMTVAGSNPAAGSILAITPTDFVVNFSQPYDATTVDANGSDLTVNGIPATSRSLTDPDTVTFHFATSPITAQGLQSMHIGAGAIAAASSVGLVDPLLHEWNASFRYDVVSMQVESTNPAGPLAGVPLTTFDIYLNEPVAIGSVSTGDLSLSQGSVTDVDVLPGGTTVRFTLAGVTEEGALDVSVAAGALTDEFGNPNLPYSASFTLVTGMGVGGSTPADGDIVVGPTAAPADFVVHFTLPYDATTVDAGDLTVNGIAATSRTLTDTDTVTFHFLSSPVTAQGAQTMHIAAGAINAASSVGLPDPAIHEWTGAFRWDVEPMQVASTTPTDGSAVQLSFTTIDVNLNEAVLLSSVQTSDLVLSQGSVTGFSLENGGTTIRFALSGITSEGTLSASISAGALADVYGNPSLAFAGSYSLDIGTMPFPTPLSPATPLGSLIHSQVASGIIGAADDTDSFTLNVAAGQTITVLVTPASSLQPTVALGASSVTATAIGKQALLQTIAASGPQTITVSGGGTLGSYTVQVLLNTALETESHDGAGNNAAPQNLDASFISLETSTVSAQRGAVMGQTDSTAPVVTVYSTNFDSTTGFTTTGLWHQSIGHRNESGHSATQSMYFGTGEKYVTKGGRPETFTKGTYEVKSKGKVQPVAGTLTSPNISLPLGGRITVDFNYILQTQGSTTVDLARLQIKPASSSTWTTLASYNGVAESSVWRASDPVDVSAYSGQNVQLRFSFDSNNVQNNFEGWYVDDLLVRQSIPHDNYSFTVTAGQRVTVALQSAGDVNVLLQNSDGSATLAEGASGAVNLRKIISNYGPLAAGTYRLAVSGQTNTPYTLVVLRDAAFDSEGNDTYATAQDITGVPGVVGHVTAGTDLFALRGAPVSGGLVLSGSKLTLGINPDGSFIAGGTGIQFLGNEFVVPGTPVAGFTIGQDGGSFTNKGALGSTEISVSMEDLSSGAFRGVRMVGSVGGILQLERVIAFSQDDEFVTIATRLTNLSGATISNVAWLENLDPDQGEPLAAGFETNNDVVLGGQFVRADATTSDFPGGLTIGMGSADARSVVSAEGFDNRDPFEIINSPEDPDGLWSDIGINLAFNFGDLPTGQAVSGSMIMTFGRTTSEAEATYSAHTGGTLVADEDWFRRTVGADGILHVETSTPGDGPGEPGNTLNPRIEVYGTSSTTPLYTGAPLADTRNEVIHVPGLVPGTVYRIRILAEDGTGGAYFLDPPASAGSGVPQPVVNASASTSVSPLLSVNAASRQVEISNLGAADVDRILSASVADAEPDWLKPSTPNVEPALLDLLFNATRQKAGSKRIPQVGSLNAEDS